MPWVDEDSILLATSAMREKGAASLARGDWAEVEALSRAAYRIAIGSTGDEHVNHARVGVAPTPAIEMADVTLHLCTNMVEAKDSAGVLIPGWHGDPGVLDHHRYRIFAHDGAEAMALLPVRRAADDLSVVDLTHVWERNWFHFLIEVCGRLAGPDAVPEGTRLLVNNTVLQGSYGEALAILAGEAAARAIPTGHWGRIGCRRLIQPKGCWTPGHYHDDPARQSANDPVMHDPAAAQAFFARARPDRAAEGLRVVLRRAPGGRARCVNEDAMIEAFEARGFVTARPETLGFREQAALFYDADVVAGVSGAAFANIAFCRPGTRVVCARSAESGSLTYAALGQGFDLDVRLHDAAVVRAGAVRDYATFAVDIDAMLEAALG